MDDSSSVHSNSSLPHHVTVERKLAKMRPAQFVHLSYDYMTNGSLDSALQIMSFAEAKGYSSDVLILLHTWCVLRAVGKYYEAGVYLERVCAVIGTAERSYMDNLTVVFDGSNVEVYAAYVICVANVLKKENSGILKPIPFQDHTIAEAMVIEAMYLKLGKEPNLAAAIQWFSSDQMWLEVGDTLRYTDYILLAEDAYWEAFIRNRHQNHPLIQIMEIKAESNRMDTALEFMLRAIQVGRFNWYLRDYFYSLEEDQMTNEIRDILESFTIEANAAIKIQSICRMRKHSTRFEIKKGELRKRKKKYNELLKKVSLMGSLTVMKNAHRLLLIWREDAHEKRLVKLYYVSKLKKYIQNYLVWLRYYRSSSKRCKLSLTYLSACQVNYDFTRLHYFHLWIKALRFVETTRAAETIKFALRTERRLEILEYHLKTTTRIGFKRNLRLVSKSLAHWKSKYEAKVRTRAKAIIRIIIRKVIRAYRWKAKKQKVEKAAAAVKDMIYSNKYQLMKRRWVKWRKLYKRNRKMWAITSLATHIPIALQRQRARVHKLNLRREKEKCVSVKCRHISLNKESVFHFWIILWSVYRIQRMVRLKIARLSLRRRRILIDTINDKYAASFVNCRDRHWIRWKQYVILWKRTKEVSASTLTTWWVRIHNSLKAVKARQHMKGSRILAGTIYKMQIKRGLKRISRSVLMIKQYNCLNKMYSRLRVFYLRLAMTRIKEFIIHHARMRDLMHLIVHRKLARIFYPGVQLSVHISPLAIVPVISVDGDDASTSIVEVTPLPDENSVDVDSHTYASFDRRRGGKTPYVLTKKEVGCDCGLSGTALMWEHFVKPRVIALKSMKEYDMLKAFQIMMASFRIRVRRLRSLSFMLAECVGHSALYTASLRCASAHTIQRGWRCAIARAKRYVLVFRCRRLYELTKKMTAKKPIRRRLFNFLKYVAFRRLEARVVLQSWIRMKLQRRTIVNRKIDFARLANLEALVHFRMKTNITRIILRHMMFNYSVRSSQFMLDPDKHPGSFSTTVLADDPLDLVAPVINRGRGNIIKEDKLFSTSMASLHLDSDGRVSRYGYPEKSLHSQSLKLKRTFSVENMKGSVVVPGALKSFTSETFHSHLFNAKKSNTVVLDSTKPMIEDDEIAYLSSITDVFFCQTGSRDGNHALKVVVKKFRGTKLVVFGGEVDLLAARELCFFVSNLPEENGVTVSERQLKLHLSGAPLKYRAVEILSRGIAGSGCWITELSVDISSIGILGMITLLAALRVSLS